MVIYSGHFTPQRQPIPESTQVLNSAGGYAWAVDQWKRLNRFLLLGAEGGTYYVNERTLTRENAAALAQCLNDDPVRTIQTIVDISQEGRAPKNTPALFALALAAAHNQADTRRLALANLTKVVRTGTHLFQFLEAVQVFRGWGRGLRSAVAHWYEGRDPDWIAYQVVKYRQRGGWTHADALRLSHPISSLHDGLFKWIVDGELNSGCPQIVHQFAQLQNAQDEVTVVNLLEDNPLLTWELVPDKFLTSSTVWQAMLPNLPMTALIRNLGRLTVNKAVTVANSDIVTARLIDQETLKRARIHPITILSALETYRQGKGQRGHLEWIPLPQIEAALETAFYRSFGNIIPTNKRIVLALDVSGSMGSGVIAGVPGLTPRVASAAMALVTARVELQHHIIAFSHQMVPFEGEPWQRLADVTRFIDQTPMGGTDCALPMIWALQNNIQADAFMVFTDSETWAGAIHPAQALQEYRLRTGIPAKLIVVAMTSNGFTIADPNDGGMLDVVGFDTATPGLTTDFINGNL